MGSRRHSVSVDCGGVARHTSMGACAEMGGRPDRRIPLSLLGGSEDHESSCPRRLSPCLCVGQSFVDARCVGRSKRTGAARRMRSGVLHRRRVQGHGADVERIGNRTRPLGARLCASVAWLGDTGARRNCRAVPEQELHGRGSGAGDDRALGYTARLVLASWANGGAVVRVVSGCVSGACLRGYHLAVASVKDCGDRVHLVGARVWRGLDGGAAINLGSRATLYDLGGCVGRPDNLWPGDRFVLCGGDGTRLAPVPVHEPKSRSCA